MCVKLRRAKFQQYSAKGAFSDVGLNVPGVGKMCFSTEN